MVQDTHARGLSVCTTWMHVLVAWNRAAGSQRKVSFTKANPTTYYKSSERGKENWIQAASRPEVCKAFGCGTVLNVVWLRVYGDIQTACGDTSRPCLRGRASNLAPLAKAPRLEGRTKAPFTLHNVALCGLCRAHLLEGQCVWVPAVDTMTFSTLLSSRVRACV